MSNAARRIFLRAALFWEMRLIRKKQAVGQDLAGAESSVRGAKR